MCGRYRQARDPREVAEFFETVNPLPNRAPSWNIAPTQDALVVRRHPARRCARCTTACR
jgi:putative SOS response-associated peptidase YedK